MSAKFYDGKYWQSGHGFELWQNRLMLAVLKNIMSPDYPKPFLTTLTNETTEEQYGVYAQWEYFDYGYSLTVEIERQELFIMGHRMVKDDNGKIDFDDEIIFGFGVEEDPDNNSWSELPSALEKVREWFVERFKDIPVNKEKELMSLVDHLPNQ